VLNVTEIIQLANASVRNRQEWCKVWSTSKRRIHYWTQT